MMSSNSSISSVSPTLCVAILLEVIEVRTEPKLPAVAVPTETGRAGRGRACVIQESSTRLAADMPPNGE
eukprot:scaffold46177_cov34-Tisochrysis_lutea.AAC.4